jgi:hypothetical protein
MKHVTLISIFFLIGVCVACNKHDNPSNAVVGTWVFTNQFNKFYSYPSVVTDPNPISASTWSLSYDSIKVRFENNRNFTFTNFRLPIANGTYTIVQDSLLVIKPDTSSFIKFCYSTPTVTFGSFIPPPVQQIALPYANFHFTSDTILFRKSSANDLAFTTFWFTKNTARQPSRDTLTLNEANSYFKRQ